MSRQKRGVQSTIFGAMLQVGTSAPTIAPPSGRGTFAFAWDDESCQLSSFQSVSTTVFAYVIGVAVATKLSQKFLPLTETSKNLQWKPWFGSDLKAASIVHNSILIVGSATMLWGVAVESIRRIRKEGGLFLLCEVESEGPASGSLYYWSYIYYLSKYYELLDTWLQLARGKPPPHFMLHVYHHAMVLLMAWAWCQYKQSLQFIGLAFNTAVHVVMYTYYLQRIVTGKVPGWKAIVTMFQIVQFGFSMFCTLVTIYLAYWENVECSGMGAMLGNVVFNITLLHSFVGVYVQGRKRRKVM